VGYLLLAMASRVGHHHVRRAFSRQSQKGNSQKFAPASN
jgi:hypothetical protein